MCIAVETTSPTPNLEPKMALLYCGLPCGGDAGLLGSLGVIACDMLAGNMVV